MGQSLTSEGTSSLICWRLLFGHPIPTLAPMLLQQPDIGHGHAAVHGFAHVVDGEEANLNGGEEVKQINNLALCELQR